MALGGAGGTEAPEDGQAGEWSAASGASSGGTSSSGGSGATAGENEEPGGQAGAGGRAGGAAGEGGKSSQSGSAGQASGGTSAGGGASSAAGVAGMVSTTPAVRFVGRFDTRDAAGPRFAWSGSGIIARFRGTSVGVRLTGDQQYSVVLDGTLRPMKLVSGSNVTSIANGLDEGEHVVELYRRTEAQLGEAQFRGFDFGDGELLAPPPAPERRIEIIGDSITCGYGNEGADMSCGFSADTENHYLTYGALSARALDAELVTVAWSGKGVVCNYGDGASSCRDPLPDYYDLALPEQASSTWDFSVWQPHAVVINLGTNDFSTDDDPREQEFATAYADFLEHIRSKYEDALILCTVGPLLRGEDLEKARRDIASAVSTRNTAGDTNVKAFELATTDANDGWGCDWHPSLKTHQKMSTTLTAKLKAELGW